MKLTLQQLLRKPSPMLRKLIAQGLERLRPRLRIDEARVVVERRPDASPAIHVRAHLVTPGPDVFAAASDHTVGAALRKALTQLDEKVVQRLGRRARRMRGNRQEPAHFRGGSMCAAGHA